MEEYGAGVVSVAGAEECKGGEGEVVADRVARCGGGGAGEVGVGGDGDSEGGGVIELHFAGFRFLSARRG
jgi:hypothetical protein